MFDTRTEGECFIMTKKVEAGGIVSPANLWGKPLPKTTHKTAPTEKETGMLPEEEIDSDVDAELENDGPSEEELVDEESEVDELEAGEDTADDDESEAEDAAEEEPDSDEAEEDEVDSTVEDDEEEPVVAETSTPARKKVAPVMSDKKKKSMSDHVREEIDRRKASGDSLRGVDIVNALKKRSVEVSPAQVSQLLKKAGVSQKARTAKPKAAPTEEKSRMATSIHKAKEEKSSPRKSPSTLAEGLPRHMRAVKALLAECDNSYEVAREALSLHQQLHDVF